MIWTTSPLFSCVKTSENILMASLAESYLDDVGSFLYAYANDSLYPDIRAIEERTCTLIHCENLRNASSSSRAGVPPQLSSFTSILMYPRSYQLFYALKSSIVEIFAHNSVGASVLSPIASVVAAQRFFDIIAAHDATSLAPSTTRRAVDGGSAALVASAAPDSDALTLHSLARASLCPSSLPYPRGCVPPFPSSSCDMAQRDYANACLKDLHVSASTCLPMARVLEGCALLPGDLAATMAPLLAQCGVLGWLNEGSRRIFCASAGGGGAAGQALLGRHGPDAHASMVAWAREVVSSALLTRDGWVSLAQRSPSHASADAFIEVLVGLEDSDTCSLREARGAPLWPLLYVMIRCGLYTCGAMLAAEALMVSTCAKDSALLWRVVCSLSLLGGDGSAVSVASERAAGAAHGADASSALWGAFQAAVAFALGIPFDAAPLDGGGFQALEAVAAVDRLFGRVGATDAASAQHQFSLTALIIRNTAAAATALLSACGGNALHHTFPIGEPASDGSLLPPEVVEWATGWASLMADVTGNGTGRGTAFIQPQCLASTAQCLAAQLLSSDPVGAALAPSVSALLRGEVSCAVSSLLRVCPLGGVDVSTPAAGDAVTFAQAPFRIPFGGGWASLGEATGSDVSLLSAVAPEVTAAGQRAVWRCGRDDPPLAVWGAAAAAAAAAGTLDAEPTSAEAGGARNPLSARHVGAAGADDASRAFGGCGWLSVLEASRPVCADAFLVALVLASAYAPLTLHPTTPTALSLGARVGVASRSGVALATSPSAGHVVAPDGGNGWRSLVADVASHARYQPPAGAGDGVQRPPGVGISGEVAIPPGGATSPLQPSYPSFPGYVGSDASLCDAARPEPPLPPVVVAAVLSLAVAELAAVASSCEADEADDAAQHLSPSDCALAPASTVTNGSLCDTSGLDRLEGVWSVGAAQYETSAAVGARAHAVAAAAAHREASSGSVTSWIRSAVSRWVWGDPATSAAAAVDCAAVGTARDAASVVDASVCACVLLASALQNAQPAVRSVPVQNALRAGVDGLFPLAVLAARCPRSASIWGTFAVRDSAVAASSTDCGGASAGWVGGLLRRRSPLEAARDAGARAVTAAAAACGVPSVTTLRYAASHAAVLSLTERVAECAALASVPPTAAGAVRVARHVALMETLVGSTAVAASMAAAQSFVEDASLDVRPAAQLAVQCGLIAVADYVAQPELRRQPTARDTVWATPPPPTAEGPRDAAHAPRVGASAFALGPLADVAVACAARIPTDIAAAWPATLGADVRDISSLVAIDTALAAAASAAATCGVSDTQTGATVAPLTCLTASSAAALAVPMVSQVGVVSVPSSTFLSFVPRGTLLASLVSETAGTSAGGRSAGTAAPLSLRSVRSLVQRLLICLHALFVGVAAVHRLRQDAVAPSAALSTASVGECAAAIVECVDTAAAALEATGCLPCTLPRCASVLRGVHLATQAAQPIPQGHTRSPPPLPLGDGDCGALDYLRGPLVHTAAAICVEVATLPLGPVATAAAEALSVLAQYAASSGMAMGRAGPIVAAMGPYHV